MFVCIILWLCVDVIFIYLIMWFMHYIFYLIRVLYYDLIYYLCFTSCFRDDVFYEYMWVDGFFSGLFCDDVLIDSDYDSDSILLLYVYMVFGGLLISASFIGMIFISIRLNPIYYETSIKCCILLNIIFMSYFLFVNELLVL